MLYSQMNKAQLKDELSALLEKYNEYKSMNLALDMSRGKPAPSQLDIANGLLDAVKSGDDFISGGFDTRNYGLLDGIKEAKALFANILNPILPSIVKNQKRFPKNLVSALRFPQYLYHE